MSDALQPTLKPGDLIGPYRLTTVAGRGGMGTVYRAADTLLGHRAVAVKVMAPHLSSGAAYRAAFLLEAQVAAEVSHPHVVPVHAAGEVDGLLYLAMAWVDGEDLGRAAATGLTPGRAVTVVQQVGRALDALHAAGIVHGDVKPSNVILYRGGGEDHAYLVDFGVARRTEFADRRTNELVGGTPAYAAPETADGPPSALSDQYALGCVLFELLAGEKPFGNGEPAVLAVRHASAERPRLSDVDPALAPFDEPVATALAVDPSARFESGAAFGRALGVALRRLADAPTVVSSTFSVAATEPDDTDPLPQLAAAPPARRPRRRGVAAVLLAVAAIAIAGGAWWAVARDGSGRGEAADAAQTKADQQAVARLVRYYEEALDRGNLTLLSQAVSDGVVRRGSDGTRAECVEDRGSAAALARWKAQLPDLAGYGLAGVASANVRVDGDTAALRARSGVGNQIKKPIAFTARLEDGNVWRLTEVVAAPCKV